MHGIAPIYHQGKFIGSVEVVVDAGNSLLAGLAGEYGNEWHILITQEVAQVSAPDVSPNYQQGLLTPSYCLILA